MDVLKDKENSLSSQASFLLSSIGNEHRGMRVRKETKKERKKERIDGMSSCL